MSEESRAAFEQAARDVLRLPKRPDNDTLLKLYAPYKQATAGDARGPKPGLFDFVNTAKHAAWSRLRGVRRDEARQRYVSLVHDLAQRG
jgi:acyl-CoA-binding protein